MTLPLNRCNKCGRELDSYHRNCPGCGAVVPGPEFQLSSSDVVVPSKIKQERFALLSRLYELSEADPHNYVPLRFFGINPSYSSISANKILNYLAREGLIEVPGTHPSLVGVHYDDMRITHEGIKAVEAAKENSSTTHFPANIYNFSGNFSNSPVLVAGNYSTLVSRIDQTYREDLSEIIKELKNVHEMPGIGGSTRNELGAKITTIETQLSSPKPIWTIISDALSSANSILQSLSTTIGVAAPLIARIGMWLTGVPSQ